MNKLFVILMLLSSSLAALPGQTLIWQDKVDPWLLARAGEQPLEFLVYLDEQADLAGAARLANKQARGAYVYQRLTETAHRSQGPLRATLEQRRVEYRAYWIANMLWVRGDLDALRFIAGRPEVAHIYPNPSIHQALPPAPVAQLPGSAITIEWNIQQVNAPQVWAVGVIGQGAVIAGQDTGYQWDHPALMNQYRGWDGAAADHNYNWHDAIHENNPNTSPGNPCGFNLLVPCDDYGHGTHTMGSMVGDDGQGAQIGMAPGARWIGCRNMESGWGTPASYAECFEWFVAPTDLNGQEPRTDLAPDVINNSWSCSSSEGCNWDSLQSVVENARAAGILVVVSASNSGPSCSTIQDPAAIYDASFSVGATDNTDQIAGFSSRGPVTVDGSGRLKPDISAPGVNVFSSYYGNSYTTMSGTSMAGPHVAGLAALLISANPSLRGQVDQLEQIMRQSAVPLTTTENCGNVPGSQVPNNTYGYGRIDALRAVQIAQPALFQPLYLPLITRQ